MISYGITTPKKNRKECFSVIMLNHSGETNPAVHFLSVFSYFASKDIIKGEDAKNSGEG